MRQLQWLAVSLVAPAYFLGTKAFTKPCVYQADKCGYTLMAVYGMSSNSVAIWACSPVRTPEPNETDKISGYTMNELTAAVNQTPSIPPLNVPQLTQVIYHCDDILGNITGNTYCINGCLTAASLIENDQCSAGTGTCPPVGCPPVYIKQCQTVCVGDNCTAISVSETVMPGTAVPMTAAPLITAF